MALGNDDAPINVALLGGGGREHAIAWKLAQSPRLGQLFALPGNPGIAAVAHCRPVNPNDPAAVVAFCREHAVGLCVIGPEDPLAAGVADATRAAGIPTFGPGKAAARLEADKAYAKQVMRNASVPTADARLFDDYNLAEQHVRRRLTEAPAVVVKATGLAKGKGVSVCRTEAEAVAAVNDALRYRKFGEAGDTVLIEDFLGGVEASVLALVDRRDLYILPACQDHKPVGEGDAGPMTGGMGAFCPSQRVTPQVMAAVERDVLIPTLSALGREGVEFSGCLYAGLMLTDKGPRVLEFNVRFGDPETQPIMMLWDGDLLGALLAVAEGRLAEFVDDGGIGWHEGAAVGVVLASGGYPGAYQTGHAISGLGDVPAGVEVFHAGTARRGPEVVTDGGRVLCVTARGGDLADAREAAYAAADGIDFAGKHLRRDIGR